jgi:hypothetical protein
MLVVKHRDASVRWSSFAFLANASTMVVVAWTSNTFYATHERGWVPYQADKLAVLVVALLSPEFATGVVSIAAFAGAAVVHYLRLPSALKTPDFNEPWTTVVYAVAALGLLWLQMRRRNAEWAMIRMQADKAAMERFARSAMAVRHLANTPLQTIELTRAHIQKSHPELNADLDRMGRALAGLRDLNAILRDYEEKASWTSSDESFDARVRLRMSSND